MTAIAPEERGIPKIQEYEACTISGIKFCIPVNVEGSIARRWRGTGGYDNMCSLIGTGFKSRIFARMPRRGWRIFNLLTWPARGATLHEGAHMTAKIFGDRVGPPPGNWRRLNDGMSIEVAGLWHRKLDVQQFIQGALAAGKGRFGVSARREPENPHGRGLAIAVDGWWRRSSFFGGARTETVHLGYVPAWAAADALEGKRPEPAVFVDLYSAYLGYDGFVDVDIIVYVERSDAEIAADRIEREAEREAKRRARELRGDILRGLKVLARIAAADGHRGPEEEREMRAYVAARYAKAGLGAPLELISDLMSSAIGAAPSDQAVAAAVRSIAENDEALSDLFDAALAVARANGSTDEGEVVTIRKIIGVARRKRERIGAAESQPPINE